MREKTSTTKTFTLALTTTMLLAGTSVIGADEVVELPNGGFEEGLKSWGKRTDTENVYQLQSPGHEGKNYVRLLVNAQDSQRDREAVYFNRRDLPTAEGYYRIRFAARSELTQGRGGVSIVNFDAENKILTSYSPGAVGIPAIQGKTPWTDYSYIYFVPPDTKMSALQLNAMTTLGFIDYDAVTIEKLETGVGKKLFEEQKSNMPIPAFVPVPPRNPQFPLKTQRMIYSDADIAAARANIAQYPEAKAVLDRIKNIADPWLEWSDDDLRKLLPSARVTRAFDLNPKGCPVHGAEVFNKGGAYPWKLDSRHPFKVTCPVGGETYPSNDYQAYVESDFKEKKGWDTEYVDDGWGWTAPDGERYWFVAYANQWNWYKTINPAILNLSRAYLLTGDKRYAHKAAVMLVRLAEVYPEMDHEWQSRYGMITRAAGGRYPGKILNAIWETFMARDFAEAYDSVWETMDGDTELQRLYGKTGPQLCSFFEANFLEDAVDAYNSERIMGNFGMHQTALLYTLLARQQMDLKKFSHQMVDEPGASTAHTGLRYALYNQVWRDGTPFESPGYNMLWIQNFAALSELLKKGGTDLFTEPKLKMLFDGPLTITNIGRHTPAIGDSAGVMAGLVGRDVEVYAAAYRAYKDARYLPWMNGASKTDNRGFTTFATLFNPPLAAKTGEAKERAVAPQPSRLLAGSGMGILNNPADTVSLAMTYGMHISHYHWDFLHFDLFANGQAMLPDLGYGDAMNGYVSSIYTWTSNTIAHNTVVVDAKKQENNRPGTLHEFADSPFARSIDASSPAYNNVEQYRRNLIQVDVDAGRSYVLDVFRVKGGKQHDYSLHGPPGQFETVGGTWSAPAKGTLAGENVALDEIYDNPTLATKDYKGVYYGYLGSGFQHLYNVQKLQSGTGGLHYRHALDANAQLKIHPLTQDVPQQSAPEVFIADAYDLPRARKNVVKYLITRRKSAGDAPLASTFVSVLEPFATQPFIQKTQIVPLTSGNGVAVRVQREGGTDIILSDPEKSRKVLADYRIETDASSAVVTLNAAGKVQRVFFSGGTFLKCGDESYAAKSVQGTVSAVDAMAQTITVTLPAGSHPDANTPARRVAHFSNPQHQTEHPIASATRAENQLTLKTSDAILVGRAMVKKAQAAKVSTDTALAFAPTYSGTTLLDGNFQPLATVKTVDAGDIELASQPAQPIDSGKDIWFSNVGVGDKMEFPPLFHWTRD